MAKKTLFAGFKPTRRRVRTGPHLVAVVAFDGVVLGDLATPLEVFALARNAEERPCYEVRTCSQQPQVKSAHVTLQVPWRLSLLKRADTVIVPGIDNIDRPIPQELLRALRAAVSRRARVASICTGAFILARTGALDGRKATTHWLAAQELSRRHPAINVDPDVLYVDNGKILTSAGAAAGFDLCLHLVRQNCGACRPRRGDAAGACGRTGSVYCLRATCCRRVDGTAVAVARAECRQAALAIHYREACGYEHANTEQTVSRTSGHDAGPVDRGGACPPRTAIAGNNHPVDRAGRQRSGIQIGIRVAGAFRRNCGNDAARLPARLRKCEIPKESQLAVQRRQFPTMKFSGKLTIRMRCGAVGRPLVCFRFA